MTPPDQTTGGIPPRFSYADYEAALRAPEYDILRQRARDTAALFRGRRRVLDVASGQGLLLDALEEGGIGAFGVDTEADLVRQCRGRGLAVAEEDALHFLAATPERFDGVNCAHFIEHLGFEAVVDLVEGVRRVLLPGGLLVLRWPNPRSVVMQHLSFWRDPTHVRQYDGQLIEAVLRFYGFAVTETHFATVEPQRHAAPSPSPSPVAPPPAAPAGEPRLSPGRALARGAYRWTQRSGAVGRVAATLKRRFLYSLVHAPRLRLLLELPLEAQIYALRGPADIP